MSREEMLQEELELVRCDLHNAYSWLESERKENQQLKSVLNEVREYEESSSFEVDTRDYGRLTVCDADELALILDKVGDK